MSCSCPSGARYKAWVPKAPCLTQPVHSFAFKGSQLSCWGCSWRNRQKCTYLPPYAQAGASHHRTTVIHHSVNWYIKLKDMIRGNKIKFSEPLKYIYFSLHVAEVKYVTQGPILNPLRRHWHLLNLQDACLFSEILAASKKIYWQIATVISSLL